MERKRPSEGEQQDGKRTAAGGQIIKILCPNSVTGAVIGKGGETINAMKAKTNAAIHIDKGDENNFPGQSEERPIAIRGSKPAMMEMILFIQDKIYKSDRTEEDRKSIVKLVVPDTTTGRIIGKGGTTVKRLRTWWGVELTPTSKEETPHDLDERVVLCSGEWDNVMGCIDEILNMIINDPLSIMEFEVDYTKWKDFEPKVVERPAPRRGGFNARGGLRGMIRPMRGGPPPMRGYRRGTLPFRGYPPRGFRGGPPPGRGYMHPPRYPASYY